jgi:hypothetical protein
MKIRRLIIFCIIALRKLAGTDQIVQGISRGLYTKHIREIQVPTSTPATLEGAMSASWPVSPLATCPMSRPATSPVILLASSSASRSLPAVPHLPKQETVAQ